MSLGRIWFRLTPWLGVVACGGAPYGQYWTDPAAAPVVSGISPNMVQTLRPGETVVVSGERLSATKSVIVGGRNAQIVSTSSTEVQISLPAGPAGGGQVDVVVITDDGFDRFEGAFTWRPPGADVWGDESASVLRVGDVECS